MIKVKRSLSIALLIVFLILNVLFSNVIYANNLETILEIVQASAEQKYLPDDGRVYF